MYSTTLTKLTLFPKKQTVTVTFFTQINIPIPFYDRAVLIFKPSAHIIIKYNN